jgi:hypothetical protein
MRRAALVWAGLVMLVGCTFEKRSSELSCMVPSDCDPGRTCVGGWCVEGGSPDGGNDGPIVDADPDAPDAPPVPDSGPFDAFVCPAGCSSCLDDLCVITCVTGSEPLCSTGLVTCPAGSKCKAECNGSGVCSLGVDCSSAATCRIECGGTNSCAGPITCGAGPCVLECQNNSCNGGIDCSASCMCMPTCGSGSCTTPPTCPALCDMGNSCKFTGPDCTCF